MSVRAGLSGLRPLETMRRPGAIVAATAAFWEAFLVVER